MSYSKEQTIDHLCSEIKKDIHQVYNANCVNRTGKTNDTKEYYTEVIAKELLSNLKNFENEINMITRKSSYCRDNHSKLEIDLKESNRLEEIFAKRIFNLEFNDIGKVIDYQLPLKDVRDDKVGKIDLLSYNKIESTLYLMEIKYIGNTNDTLLKTLLEIYTYFKIVNHDKLLKDFELATEKGKIKIQPAVLLVNSQNKPSNAYKEFEDLDNRPMLRALLLALGIKIFSCQLDEIIISEFI